MLAIRFCERERGMKTVWIASVATAFAMPALAQTVIYKHVDESGRVTYSNKPMKGATILELDPLTTIPGLPQSQMPAPPPAAQPVKAATPAEKAQARPAVAIVTPIVDRDLQRKRDNDRRKILETELEREEQSLADARKSLSSEQTNPQLVAVVRTMQQATEPTPAELLEYRRNIDKASGRIRGLQATVAEHEKNIEALKKELAALKS
jgi:hypothetical protein